MSEITEVTKVNITRTVTVELDENEYLPARGDRKGNGYRVARATRLRIEYRFANGVWSAPPWNVVTYFMEQQRADGSWSAAKWKNWPGFGSEINAELVARYWPTVAYTVTEVTS